MKTNLVLRKPRRLILAANRGGQTLIACITMCRVDFNINEEWTVPKCNVLWASADIDSVACLKYCTSPWQQACLKSIYIHNLSERSSHKIIQNTRAVPLGAHLVVAGQVNQGTTGRYGWPTKYIIEKKVNTDSFYLFIYYLMPRNKLWYTSGDEGCGQVSSELRV